MRFFILLFALLFTNRAIQADVSLPNGITEVSIVSLLANPEKYDGKKVRLIGYFQDRFEGRAIFLTRDDARINNHANSIWVEEVSAGTNNAIEPVRKGFIRIDGTFKSYPHGGGGHFGMWSGTLSIITALRALK
jgi:hypothetical protein